MSRSATARSADLDGVLLRRVVLRHWRQAPWQSLLLIAIVAMGIAVFFSVRLANRAAVASFQNFSELITSDTDGTVGAAAGDLPEGALRELREALVGLPVTLVPIVETTAVFPGTPTDKWLGDRVTFQLLGLDLVSLQNLAQTRDGDRSWFGQSTESIDVKAATAAFWRTLRSTDQVFISQGLATSLGKKPGDRLELVVRDRPVTLQIAGLVPKRRDGPNVPDTLLVMDLPALQQSLGKAGRLDRVEWVVEDGPDVVALREDVFAKIAAAGGDRWRVSRPADRRAAATLMTRAFRVNLTILSLLALLVGLYLVFQALDGAVVRRRAEIGTLRSLGVEPAVVQRVHLVESSLLGLIGSTVGVLLGWGGAQLAVRAVGRTVNTLYYATTVDAAQLNLGEALLAIALGALASVVAGWLPARQAAATPPVQLMSRAPIGVGARVPKLMVPAFVAVLVGSALLIVPPLRLAGGVRFPVAGYVVALAWIAGAGLLAAASLPWVARLAHRFSDRQVALRLAAAAMRRPSSRHRWALAGLICAFAMSVGMAILVSSFEFTMRTWIERTLRADLYIASDGAQSASARAQISPEIWQSLVADPRVEAANILSATPITLNDTATILAATNLGFVKSRIPLSWVSSPQSDDVFDATRNATLALVSEAFSERFALERGDIVPLPTPRGVQRLTIAGVFADYGNERGTVMIDRAHYLQWFDDMQVSTCELWVKRGVDAAALRLDLLQRFPGLQVLGSGEIRREALRVFRQTFGITYALEAIGIAVAVAGLGLALGSMLLERREQLTTLRAIGMSHKEIARTAATEGTLLTLTGISAGLSLGLALGWLLIRVINKQTFGWTLGFDWPWATLGLLSVAVLASGSLVSYAAGRWGAALPADHEE